MAEVGRRGGRLRVRTSVFEGFVRGEELRPSASTAFLLRAPQQDLPLRPSSPQPRKPPFRRQSTSTNPLHICISISLYIYVHYRINNMKDNVNL